MPDFATSQLEIIDGQVAAGRRTTTKMGTVQDRDTTGARVMVALDGSSGVPQPVKCFEGVVVQEGDRVGLVKFEADWIIVGNYTLRTLGAAQYMQEWSTNVTTSSASYTDMPTSPAVTMYKFRDATQIRIRFALSMFTTVVPSVFRIGALVSNALAGISYDQNVIKWRLDTANAHFANAGIVTTTGVLPAGLYTITARWLRISGTGNGVTNADDQISMEIEEVVA